MPHVCQAVSTEKRRLPAEHGAPSGARCSRRSLSIVAPFVASKEGVSACPLHRVQMTLVLEQLNLPRGCACSA